MDMIEKIALGATGRAAAGYGAVGAGIGGLVGAFSKKKKGESRLGRIARGAGTGAATGAGYGAVGLTAARGVARAAGKKGIPYRQMMRGKKVDMNRRAYNIAKGAYKPGGGKLPAAIAAGGLAGGAVGGTAAYKATRRKDKK